MSLRPQGWAKGLSPTSKAIAGDMNENGIVVQRGLILSYCIALLKADLGVQAVGRVWRVRGRLLRWRVNQWMASPTARQTSRIVLARSVRKTSPALSKPYMTQQPVSGRSVGLQEPSKSRISYGRSVKRWTTSFSELTPRLQCQQ